MFNALILGLIQGLSEFLPISSSGHVTVVEAILGIKEDTGFAAAIHIATALAAIIYFRKDIWNILKAFKNFNEESEEKSLGLNIIYATIPAVIFGLIVTQLGIDKYFSSPLAIGISAIVFGILLLLADFYSKKNVNTSNDKQTSGQTDKLTILHSLIIGSSQIIAAIFPGASRSGVTLTTSLFLKLERENAAKFIFLISIPITLLASTKEIFIDQSVHLDTDFFIAFTAAFISGLIAIKFLLYFITQDKLKWLVAYRVIFGIVAILIALQ